MGYFEKGQFSRNPSDPTAKLYSILDRLESFRSADGLFEFKLQWPLKSGKNYNHWKQQSNPVTKTTGGVDGYKGVDVSFTGSSWGGLEYNNNRALLDGAVDTSAWWFAVGAISSYQGGIPSGVTAGGQRSVEKVVELYVRQNSGESNSDENQIVVPSAY